MSVQKSYCWSISFLVFFLLLLVSPIPARADNAAAFESAHKEFEAGDYPAAMSTLREIMAASPNDAKANYWLARCYYELRDFNSAITYAEKAVHLEPQNSLYHQWLGRSYGEKADREHSFFLARKVKKEFQQAVKLDPSNLEARLDLMEFDIDAPWVVGGNKDEAREQIEAISAADPIEGHLARAAFFLRVQKKPDLAENEYRQILEAKPAKIEPYLEIVGFYQHQSKPSEMETAMQAAAAVNASDPRLAYYRGVARIVSGNQLAAAEQYLKKYIASTPERSDWPSHAAARLWLGQLYEKEGKRAEAAEQYRAALQIDPARKDARERLAQLEKSSH